MNLNRIVLSLGLMLAAAWGTDATAAESSLPRSTPEAQGVDSVGILNFVKAADKELDSIHSFMLVRNGKVVAESWWAPESADKPHIMWSLTKSFTSTAVGLAQAEGKLSIDDKVLKYFPETAPEKPSDNLKAMRIRDLLTMSVGHERQPRVRDSDVDWTKQFLAHPVKKKPGTFFRYNTPASYMLGAIVKKTTGEDLADYLEPRLFKPLGIRKPKWLTSPQGLSIGGYGLYVRTEDIAKFGQLYLQNGKWKGKQLLPENWVKEATSKQVDNSNGIISRNSDWLVGYGYQFWQCRHGVYRGDGKDGQFCIVMPQYNTVVAMTADNQDMQAQLNLVWEHILPALKDKPLPANKKAQRKLKRAVAKLKASK